MQFEDIRLEWRINEIEGSLRQKADTFSVDSLRGHVDSLERSLWEVSSACDGLRSELETMREEIIRLRERT